MTRYWLSYDLGLRGNYDELYAWLDENHAEECGDSIATFQSDLGFAEVRSALKPIVGSKARLYLIGRETTGKWTGKWLQGHRRSAPWTGYGKAAEEQEDEA